MPVARIVVGLHANTWHLAGVLTRSASVFALECSERASARIAIEIEVEAAASVCLAELATVGVAIVAAADTVDHPGPSVSHRERAVADSCWLILNR